MYLKRLPRFRLPGTVTTEREGKGGFVSPSPYHTGEETKYWIKEKSFLRSHMEFKAEPGLQETHLNLNEVKMFISIISKVQIRHLSFPFNEYRQKPQP